jgi:GMP synthase-like glutamine amidotransferase
VKPVLILQNLSGDGPAYLRTWLEREGVPFELRDAEAGDARPAAIGDWSALAVLGGEMSANDELPFLRETEDLIRQAVSRGVPTIGHCLGGQLMARALGARVVDSPAPEIGWQPMDCVPGTEAQAWFGTEAHATVFHWHGEAFELPPGAVRLAGSAACPNQAFALGPHLAMQFHLEIDDAKLRRWSLEDSASYREAQRAHPASVQMGEAMRADAALHMAAHHARADRVYRHWLQGASR